ncbi:MAG TPA: maleylpyruvate isomerase family mycothiol-dependent enzyme [Micromonosporaceae bacterium]
MIESAVVAASLPYVDRDQAAAVGAAESRAMLDLLRQLGGAHWSLRTDCPEWDVRTMVAHLVAQCEDSIRFRTMLRREISGRRRYRDRPAVDAHMAAQLDDHRDARGPALVERFAELWPAAVEGRRTKPALLRRITFDAGIPGLPRFSFGYLFDVVLNRDLWMHRIDLTRATGLPFVIGEHDRQIVAQVIRDLALGWAGPPVALELTGPAGGAWLIGSGDPVASVRADAVTYARALAGRDPEVDLTVVSGDPDVVPALRRATVLF